ncbi:Stonustoxin subunit alpha [Anabarilius grahami]|uniref:Stonustoxin subunit alpha n=1 Tax=Anabarilius grahami TaxID=495550 RepID=A0A3N0Y1L0_ANAGA|nr:Stonustoxin subunit alpha [Anabarilius grahami]
MAKPAPYSGSAEDCSGFLLQCALVLEMQPHLYPNDTSKIAFIISQLQGKALKWADSLWTQKGPVVQSYNSFVTHFREVFGKPVSDSSIVTFTNIVPRTRNDFLQYSHQLNLDLNTVNQNLSLSERNRVITYTEAVQPYPDHPDRFDVYPQVLCRQSVCGRCYWEIERNGEYVRISVSYKSISRKGFGNDCVFGSNDQSWGLICFSSSYSFRHKNIETKLPVKSISRRIGVYVDHSAGTLSFYSVSGDTMSLIHTVQTTFTQPLYPGFTVYPLSLVKLC